MINLPKNCVVFTYPKMGDSGKFLPEELRGVAGLTQSNGEPGGTINLIRKRPSDQFGFNASLSGGSWDNYRGMIDVTDAINQSGTARARLIGIFK